MQSVVQKGVYAMTEKNEINEKELEQVTGGQLDHYGTCPNCGYTVYPNYNIYRGWVCPRCDHSMIEKKTVERKRYWWEFWK